MTTRRALLAAALSRPGCAIAQGRITSPLSLPDAAPAGPLRLLGGLQIDRLALGFGGLSGAHLAPDLTLSLVSDVGRFATMRLDLDSALRPRAMHLLRQGPLRDAAGRPLTGHWRDAEALALLPDGSWLIAFERRHRIRRYQRLDGPSSDASTPPGLAAGPFNGGLESLTLLPDGRLLAMAEFLPGPAPGTSQAWIGGGSRSWQPFAYRPAEGMAPVDAAALPDGDVLVLERGFTILGGFTARLARIAGSALRGPPPVVAGREMLRLEDPLPPENWEAVAVARVAGQTLVALVSDDNERGFQRSLFLLFAWNA